MIFYIINGEPFSYCGSCSHNIRDIEGTEKPLIGTNI